jgi:4-diphosphocytidyl-2-C-methyl-D-erythritol kinase
LSAPSVRERAYAKLNLVLHVGGPRADGLHRLCSVFASIDLADAIEVAPANSAADSVDCPGVEGPNLAATALRLFRERVPSLPPLAVRIAKRIPVAAGLGGGSADAAAVLRAANRIAGDPLEPGALREIGARLGSDVPSQVEPRHALVGGTGEIVEPIELPAAAAVLVPREEGLSTAAVYEELDRIRGWRERLDLDRLRALVTDASPAELGKVLENDLQPAALRLRPELGATLAELRAAGALGVLVSGSGPTCFGLFADEPAAVAIPGALTARLRS